MPDDNAIDFLEFEQTRRAYRERVAQELEQVGFSDAHQLRSQLEEGGLAVVPRASAWVAIDDCPLPDLGCRHSALFVLTDSPRGHIWANAVKGLGFGDTAPVFATREFDVSVLDTEKLRKLLNLTADQYKDVPNLVYQPVGGPGAVMLGVPFGGVP